MEDHKEKTMRDSSFFCLMVSGPRLNADIRNRLLMVAGKMHVERRSQLDVKCPYFEGRIRTRFEVKVLGGTSGVHFTAELETAFSSPKTIVSFLVPVQHLREVDLESQIWINLFTGEVEIPEKMYGYDRAMDEPEKRSKNK